MSNSTISTRVANELMDLSNINSDQSLTAEDKKSKFDKVKTQLLSDIALEKNSLNVSTEKFINQILDFIINDDFSNIPSPTTLEKKLDDLEVIVGVIDNMNSTLMVDVLEMLWKVSSILSERGLIKNDERIQERKQMVESANAEFASREDAARKQLYADLATSIAQVVTSVVQVAVAAVSLKKMGAAIKSSAESVKIGNDLDGLQAKQLTAETKMKQIEVDINTKIREIKTAPKIKQAKLKQELADLKQAKIELRQDIKMNNLEINKAQNNINKLNQISRNITEETQALGQLFQGINAGLKSIGDLAAAGLKFDAAMMNIDADKKALAKNLSNSSTDAAQDAYQKLMNSIDSLRQTVAAIVQMMGSLGNSLATRI